VPVEVMRSVFRRCRIYAVADAVEAALRPLVRKHGRGALALDRSVEKIRSCGMLREFRRAQLAVLF